MPVNPYLFFNGQCEAAFKFYAQCLGGKIISMMTVADTPVKDQTPPDRQGTIIHARMMIGDSVLMASDAPPERYQPPAGFSVTLMVDDPKEAERVFGELAEGGTVQMAIAETFWALRFGMLVDRFSIPWMINCEKPRA
jgi:PhnB protein